MELILGPLSLLIQILLNKHISIQSIAIRITKKKMILSKKPTLNLTELKSQLETSILQKNNQLEIYQIWLESIKNSREIKSK